MDNDGEVLVLNKYNDAMTDIRNGSVAGALGKIIEYPFDTVKVRLQTQNARLFPNTWACIKHTYANEGIRRGFFQGLQSPLFGAALENAVLFVGYNQCSQWLGKNTNVTDLSKIIWSGAFAGSCASFVLTPIELVKCKLQVSNITSQHKYTKVLPTIQHILSQRGILGLWQGQTSTFCREAFGGIAWFATYELMKKSLTHDSSSAPETWRLLVSGASAGLAFNASIFPIDTIKSVMQTEQLSLKAAVQTILLHNGLKGFYRGLAITLLRAAPANATVFYTYETLSSL